MEGGDEMNCLMTPLWLSVCNRKLRADLGNLPVSSVCGLIIIMWPRAVQGGAACRCDGESRHRHTGENRKFYREAVGSERASPTRRLFVSMTDIDDHHEQLQRDAQFLCSHKRMDTELVDRLVLQLNRIYPQILSDKEAHRFRNLSVPTKVRLAELLKHLYWKGEEACHEFYRGLHIHAEDVYSSLPTRVTQREVADPKWAYSVAIYPKRYVLNDRGPMFFLSCLSFVVGIAILYYYKEGETLRCTGPFLHCSAARLSKTIIISYAEVGRQKKWSC